MESLEHTKIIAHWIHLTQFSCLWMLSFGIEDLAAFDPAYENAPVHYSDTSESTSLTRYFAKVESGEETLPKNGDRAVLEHLLKVLEVPIESQVLVYSKTSAQNSRISPETPRAIYHSDNAYVGWVQGGNIEVATFDSKLGVVFHLVELSGLSQSQKPTLVRDRSCLNCHAGSSNYNFPGLMVRSVFPREDGQPFFHAGSFHTRQDSPIEERWGGWYVTGSVEGHSHMGNSIAKEGETRDDPIILNSLTEKPVHELSQFIDGGPYSGGARSDVVSLMILEHQVSLHNELIRANLVTQQTLHRHREMKKAFGEPIDSPLSETNQNILDHHSDDILEQMLFANELDLPEQGIEGSLEFQSAFQENRKKDNEGRSLKDLRLYERLFKYRCSYLIYSEAFTSLPEEIKSIIYRKLHSILTNPQSHPEYLYLGSSERKRIYQILSGTITDLPDYWKEPEEEG